MALRELRCPNCGAPVEPSQANAGRCAYCGTTLVTDSGVEGPTEEWYGLTLKVAPSNVERIARLLQKRLGIEQEKARELAASSPVEVEVGTDKSRARQLARDIIESGGQADITLRRVAIRMRNVMLAAVGAKKFAVIAALREHVDLGIVEAKTLVEEAPSVVATEMVQPRAEALVAALKAAGAQAHLT
jgi:ribosomal protein L7/L12